MAARGGNSAKRQFKPNLAAAGKKEARSEAPAQPNAPRSRGGVRNRGRNLNSARREVVTQDGGVFYGSGKASGSSFARGNDSGWSQANDTSVVFRMPKIDPDSSRVRVRAAGWTKRTNYNITESSTASADAGYAASASAPSTSCDGDDKAPSVKQERLIDDMDGDSQALIKLLDTNFIGDLKRSIVDLKPVEMTNIGVFDESVKSVQQKPKYARATIIDSDSDDDAQMSREKQEAKTKDADLLSILKECDTADLDCAPNGLLFLQLPNVLSKATELVRSGEGQDSDSMEVDVSGTNDASSSKQSQSNTNMGASSSANNSAMPEHCLAAFENGTVGKLQIMKSGKARLRIGNQYMDVALGSPINCMQESVRLRTVKDETGVVRGGEMNVIGQPKHRLVCTYNLDKMLDQCQKS